MHFGLQRAVAFVLSSIHLLVYLTQLLVWSGTCIPAYNIHLIIDSGRCIIMVI